MFYKTSMAEKNHPPPPKKNKNNKNTKIHARNLKEEISLFHCDVNYIFEELESLNP